ncbi:MAG: hypothetical protein ACYDBB_00990 [Armatimonadota bacterium]
MRMTGITLLVMGLLAVALTAVFAAGQGKGNGQCQGQQACDLSKAKVVTLEGTISDLVQPEAGKKAGPVQFNLVVDKATSAVRLGPPHALKAMELTLKNVDAVKITGWQITQEKSTWIVVHELTLKDKTYTLRAEDGTPTWRGQGGCGRGRGQGNRQCNGGQCKK